MSHVQCSPQPPSLGAADAGAATSTADPSAPGVSLTSSQFARQVIRRLLDGADEWTGAYMEWCRLGSSCDQGTGDHVGHSDDIGTREQLGDGDSLLPSRYAGNQCGLVCAARTSTD